MNVKEFVAKYIGYPAYAQDRKLINQYPDEEVFLYAAAGGTTLSYSGKPYPLYTSVMLFHTKRLTVAFVNGQRAKMATALRVLETIECVSDRSEDLMADLRMRATMEAI